jgi:hypothetical protein
MRRRTVAVLVLGGIWLAGGIGGRMMAQGGKPRPRPAAARRAAGAPPLKVASEACPALAAHPEMGCDLLVTSGD